MKDVSSDESPFSTFSSRNYDKLDDPVNELEAKRSMTAFNGTESYDGFGTFINSDADDCTVHQVCVHTLNVQT